MDPSRQAIRSNEEVDARFSVVDTSGAPIVHAPDTGIVWRVLNPDVASVRVNENDGREATFVSSDLPAGTDAAQTEVYADATLVVDGVNQPVTAVGILTISRPGGGGPGPERIQATIVWGEVRPRG